jgi:hypothetical protein
MALEILSKQLGYLKACGIDYANFCCPVGISSSNWNFTEADFYRVRVPDGEPTKKYLVDHFEKIVAEMRVSKPWADEAKCMLVRGQLFIDEAHDSSEKFILFQP